MITSHCSLLSCQFQVDPGKHNMLKGGFYNKCAVIVHFKWQNWEKEVISLHVGLRVCRKTEMFLFFGIFGDRDEGSIVGIKKELRKTLISSIKAILSL